MTLSQQVEHEIKTSWWAGFMFTEWMQEKAADYFVKKAARKLQVFRKTDRYADNAQTLRRLLHA